ncbi:MAG: hypothetical protein KME31_31870 [Tolypothrix carrinoi HA7290-LM1]|jgi:hypothetical protein|nr:hypothetical protein [Tolypothrix carrinoi HA7290-LM1]
MMKAKLLDLIEVTTVSLGVSGAIMIMVGGGSCLLGLSGKVINNLSQALEPQQPIIKNMMFYGAVSTSAGLFLVGSGVGIAKFVGENLLDEEMIRVDAELRQKMDVIENQCRHCKYHSPNGYLPCAVNPEQPENCPDFERNN